MDLTAGDMFDDLVLAVYEAIANTVDHAYAQLPEPGPVRLIAADPTTPSASPSPTTDAGVTAPTPRNPFAAVAYR
jgi:hypothetical protein